MMTSRTEPAEKKLPVQLTAWRLLVSPWTTSLSRIILIWSSLSIR